MTKPKISLLPPQGVLLAADVMSRAERPDKYPSEKWKGISVEEHINSALRHIFAYLSGELVDEELQTSHLANASCRLLMASEVEHLASAAPPVASVEDTISDYGRMIVVEDGMVKHMRDGKVEYQYPDVLGADPAYEAWLEEADRKFYGAPQEKTIWAKVDSEGEDGTSIWAGYAGIWPLIWKRGNCWRVEVDRDGVKQQIDIPEYYCTEVPEPQPDRASSLNDFPPEAWDKAAKATLPLFTHHTPSGDTTRTNLYDKAIRGTPFHFGVDDGN